MGKEPGHDAAASPARSGRGPELSRRKLLKLGGGGIASAVALGAAGAVGYEWPQSPAGGAATVPGASPDSLVYHSRPDLNPPRLQFTSISPTPDYGYYLLTPNHGHVSSGPGQVGVMMLDDKGAVVWFHPTSSVATNLQVQTYKGEPVLTWWQGTVTASGHGVGTDLVYDASYNEVAAIRGVNGLHADLHDFTLTPQDTALMTAYLPRAADLSSIGGPAHGSVLDCAIQEIDVATGKLLFEWRSLDHVAVAETYATPPAADLDYFHINSVSLDPSDGNLLVSARNTWALYKVDRHSGAIIWRLGGKKSDFQIGPGAEFSWQHHSRLQTDGTLTVFDDADSPQEEPQSRGLHLAIDQSAHTVRLLRAYLHPARLLTANQGSMELLANGGAVVGWGSEPYLTEFAPDGSIATDARLPNNGQSYRAFRSPWRGAPAAKPNLTVVADDAGGYTVYVSWNGATEVTTWQALSGNDPASLAPVGQVPRAGFETAMTVHPSGKYIAMAALEGTGKRLGLSPAVAV